MHFAKKCLLLISALGLLNSVTYADSSSLWKDQAHIAARTSTQRFISSVKGISNARHISLDAEAMKALLLPSTNANLQARTITSPSIEVPLPDGSNITLKLESTNILPTTLASKFNGIKTYKVSEANGDIISGRIDYTEHGFHAMLQTFDGQTLFIDPASKTTTENYLSYRKSEQTSNEAFQCSAPEHNHDNPTAPLQSRLAARTRSNEGIIEYRIAIAATAEYTQLQGGTVSAALSAIATTLNRVNHVYEQSLGVRLSLIENNDQLIYTNTATDPYSNYQIESMLGENQRNLDNLIGRSNYDIGHVFGTSGGGLAYIGSVCNSTNKARGASGIRNPNNDSFDIDYVAHEIGHQFGATHTFNSNQGICTSGARTARSAFEPGSGSSIMSYVGGCGTDDLQSFADAMFHSGNIEQINNNVLNGTASSCGIVHQTNNSAPLAIAGNSYTIPANTPFELKAEAVDADADTLQYSWEQIDVGTTSTLKVDTGSNPLFRILPPTADATRSFPAMSTILGGAQLKGETLPSTDRVMNFQLAVYDGHHVPSLDRVSIQVNDTGEAFKLEAPATQYAQGSTIDITWNTANTQFSPISCASVDLSLSTDGGNHFSIALANNLPNEGKAAIFLPENIRSTSTGRFKLSCSNNIFFSISSSNFAINQNIDASAAGTRSSDNSSMAENNSISGGGSMGFTLFILLFAVNLSRKISLS